MDSTGELSADKKTMTWTMNLTNPVTHQTEHMREVEHFVSDNETHMEMWGSMGSRHAGSQDGRNRLHPRRR